MKSSLGEGFDHGLEQHERFASDETASSVVMEETVTPMLRSPRPSSKRSTSVQFDALSKRQLEVDTMRVDESKTIATARANLEQGITRVRRPSPRFETAALLSSTLLLPRRYQISESQVTMDSKEHAAKRKDQASVGRRSERRRMCLAARRGDQELAVTVRGVRSRIVEEIET